MAPNKQSLHTIIRDVSMKRACNCKQEARRLFAAVVSSPAVLCLTIYKIGNFHGML